ncbi:MAG: dihydroxyacetone kinase subunit DhaL [Limnochordia bacterium]
MEVKDLALYLEGIQAEVVAAKDWLIDLDAAIGDGDLGLTMTRGFTAVAEECRASDETDLGKLLVKLGMTFNRVAPSTMGTLMAAAFMRAGRALKGETELKVEQIPALLEAAIEGIKDRGKSQRGDKTIIDVLEPATEKLKEELEAGQDLAEAWAAAAVVAEEAFEATAEMESKVGRAGWFGAQSKGKLDPGAGLGLVVWRAIGKCLE